MSSTKVIIYDSNMFRTFADTTSSHFPLDSYVGSRIFIPEDRTIYEYNGFTWNIKYINKSCMRNIEVYLREEGKREFF